MGILLVEGTTNNKNKIYDIAVFTLQYLFSNKDHLDDLEITIELVKDLHNKFKICGDILDLEDNQYHIRIDRNHDEMYITLIHELIHCWQYYYNIINKDINEYQNRPHEIQAYFLENLIYEKYLENKCIDIATN